MGHVYFFFFQVTQAGIEPGYPRTVYPDDVIHQIIGHVGLPIYVVNEVPFIYHTLMTFHIYATYKIYNIQIRYILFIYEI